MVETDVLIVGAGPAGLTLACELLRRGVRCRIIDKADGYAATSRAMGIHARTMEVFDALGLAPAVLAQGKIAFGVTIVEGNRVLYNPMQHWNKAARQGEPFYGGTLIQSQAVTETILRAHLETLGGMVERSARLTEFRQDAASVVASVLHFKTLQAEQIRCAYLVGCDGPQSLVRDAVGLQLEGGPSGEYLALGDFEMETSLPRDSTIFWYNRKGLFTAVPFPNPRQWRLMAAVSPDAAGNVPQASPELFRRILVERAGDISTRLGAPAWLANMKVQRCVANHYRQGRVFIAGDAAHLYSPAGGQAINVAMQDAFNLGWKLAMVLRGRSGPALLDTYEEERRPIAQLMMSEADAQQKISSLPYPLFSYLHDRAFIPVLKLPGVAEFFARRGEDLDVNYREMSLALGSEALNLDPATLAPGFLPGPQAGDLAPDATLLTESQSPVRLYDQLRFPGFTLLLFEGARREGGGLQALLNVANQMKAQFGEELRTRLILAGSPPDPHLTGSGTWLQDFKQQAHRLYGASAPALYLIRPDGYVAFRGQPGRENLMLKYLNHWLPGNVQPAPEQKENAPGVAGYPRVAGADVLPG